MGAQSALGETTAARVARPLTASNFWIGAYNGGAPYDGSIGHVVVFDRKLSAADFAVMQAWLDSEVA
jgi:hypothetical protein